MTTVTDDVITSDLVYVSSSTWRGQETVAHLETDCLHIKQSCGADESPRQVAVETLHPDTHVCKRCDPTTDDSFGGATGLSPATRLRHGIDIDTDSDSI
jgi:hypothetical protein